MNNHIKIALGIAIISLSIILMFFAVNSCRQPVPTNALGIPDNIERIEIRNHLLSNANHEHFRREMSPRHVRRILRRLRAFEYYNLDTQLWSGGPFIHFDLIDSNGNIVMSISPLGRYGLATADGRYHSHDRHGLYWMSIRYGGYFRMLVRGWFER